MVKCNGTEQVYLRYQIGALTAIAFFMIWPVNNPSRCDLLSLIFKASPNPAADDI